MTEETSVALAGDSQHVCIYMSCVAACRFLTPCFILQLICLSCIISIMCCSDVCLLGETANWKVFSGYRGQNQKDALVRGFSCDQKRIWYVLFYSLLCERMETQLSGNEALKLQALMLWRLPFQKQIPCVWVLMTLDLMRERSWPSDVYCFSKIRHALMWINFTMRLWSLWNQDRTDERQKFSL